LLCWPEKKKPLFEGRLWAGTLVQLPQESNRCNLGLPGAQ
jgi:hypothetical protein